MPELKVGLLGAGHIAEAHLAAWERAGGCRVEGVFDLDGDQAAARTRRFRLPRVFGSAEALIAACDVVDVCTPPHTHAELVGAAAEAGRHLLVEKPVVTRAAEWRRVAPAIAASPGALAVVHNLKYSRGVLQARRWVEEGRIGRVLRLERRFLTSPRRDRMLVGDRHWSHRLPGGRWFETLPHELYLIHLFLGPLALEHVTALGTSGAPLGAPADEVQLTFAGDAAIATVHYSAHCDVNHRSLTLYGTEGIVHVDILSDTARWFGAHDRAWRRAAGAPFLEAAGTLLRAVPDRLGYAADRGRGASPHRKLIQAFAAHLRGDGPSPTPLDEIEYVVLQSEAVGLAIDAALAAGGGRAETASTHARPSAAEEPAGAPR